MDTGIALMVGIFFSFIILLIWIPCISFKEYVAIRTAYDALTGKTDQTREQLQKILAKYPDTGDEAGWGPMPHSVSDEWERVRKRWNKYVHDPYYVHDPSSLYNICNPASPYYYIYNPSSL